MKSDAVVSWDLGMFELGDKYISECINRCKFIKVNALISDRGTSIKINFLNLTKYQI